MIALTMFAKCSTALVGGSDVVPVHSVHVMFCLFKLSVRIKILTYT